MRRPWAALAVTVVLFLAAAAHAIPLTTIVEGILTASGGPAADGESPMTFAVHEAADSAAPAWKEVSMNVA